MKTTNLVNFYKRNKPGVLLGFGVATMVAGTVYAYFEGKKHHKCTCNNKCTCNKMADISKEEEVTFREKCADMRVKAMTVCKEYAPIVCTEFAGFMMILASHDFLKRCVFAAVNEIGNMPDDHGQDFKEKDEDTKNENK